MTDPSWTDIITAIGTGFTALGTVALAIAAFWALNSWRTALASQRADECLAAARDLEGVIGRLISLRGKTSQNEVDRQEVRDASRAMWDSSRRFDQAFSAARRYHSILKENTAGSIMEKLAGFGRLKEPLIGKDLEQADRIKAEIGILLVPVYTL